MTTKSKKVITAVVNTLITFPLIFITFGAELFFKAPVEYAFSSQFLTSNLFIIAVLMLISLCAGWVMVFSKQEIYPVWARVLLILPWGLIAIKFLVSAFF